MTNYSAGKRVEDAARSMLRDNGYTVFRSAGSKGIADLIAIKPAQVCFVQCKRASTALRPRERADLIRLASCVQPPTESLPLLATGPLSRPLFWRLTGVGPDDREPWDPDQLALFDGVTR